MIRITRITNARSAGQQRAAAAWQAINRQPSWLVKAVALVFVLVIGLPILLLAILAFLIATLFFTILWGVNRLVLAVKGRLPVRDGRENVRVIRRTDGQ